VFPRLTLSPASETELFPLPFELSIKFKESNNILKFELLSLDRKLDIQGAKTSEDNGNT
jgi:hypothetical protein